MKLTTREAERITSQLSRRDTRRGLASTWLGARPWAQPLRSRYARGDDLSELDRIDELPKARWCLESVIRWP
jgi:hypothetical protein